MNRSKYEQAWRTRAGHDTPVPSEATLAPLREALDRESDRSVTLELPQDQVLAPAEPVPTGPAVLDALIGAALGAPDPAPKLRRCSKCGGTDHTARTCKATPADEPSDAELERLTAPDAE